MKLEIRHFSACKFFYFYLFLFKSNFLWSIPLQVTGDFLPKFTINYYYPQKYYSVDFYSSFRFILLPETEVLLFSKPTKININEIILFWGIK